MVSLFSDAEEKKEKIGDEEGGSLGLVIGGLMTMGKRGVLILKIEMPIVGGMDLGIALV